MRPCAFQVYLETPASDLSQIRASKKDSEIVIPFARYSQHFECLGVEIRSLSDVAETWWDAVGIFECLDTDSFSARCQNREGHSPLAIHTAVFAHVLVLLAAGFALCFGKSINLT